MTKILIKTATITKTTTTIIIIITTTQQHFNQVNDTGLVAHTMQFDI
jgi:hypothetical protein